MSTRVFALGNRTLIMYLAFLSAFAPLSTDMYLPALPVMTQALHTTYALSSLTVSCFLLVFALSMLLWGPLSDKYGRKPVLYTGTLLYVLASAGIAVADSIVPLLGWRGVQAVGSGAVSAMSLAIVKDVLRGRAMEKVVIWIQTITILAPMLAPVVGGGLLLLTDWRGIFWCLTLCGLLALGGVPLLSETLSHPVQGTMGQALRRIPFVLHNKKFTALLVLFSTMCMPFMAYIAVSSYIFQEMFGLSAQHYSALFAVNAAASLAGPLVYVRFFQQWNKSRLITCYLSVICAAGLLLTVGASAAWIFVLLCAPISFCSSALRPLSTVLMMNQFHSDNGTVTALINSGGLLCGSLAMLLCSLPLWSNYVLALGCVSFCIGGLGLWAWLWLDRREYALVC